jgi:hypothetical protein
MTLSRAARNSALTRRTTLALASFGTIFGINIIAAPAAPAQEKGTSMNDRAEIEHIYKRWDDALGANDLDAAVALYAEDASIESPLVQHLLKTESGIVQGRENLRPFIKRVFETKPPARKRFRTGFFTDGRTVTWEYPRVSPEGQQMDLVEVMEIDNGFIKHHKVYWGWYALSVLKEH